MKLVSMAEAAASCGVTVRTVRRWVSTGRITSHGRGVVDLDEMDFARSRARPRLADWMEALR